MIGGSGLKDLITYDTHISSIINDNLSYVGYNISELVSNDASFEEAVYLLWNLHLPSKAEFDSFVKELRGNYAISDAVKQCVMIRSRSHLHPMSVLRSTVSLLGVYNVNAEDGSEEATYGQSIQLMARMLTITAAFARLCDRKTPVAPRESLGLTANFLYILNSEEPTPLQVKALDRALVLYAGHELNTSTFATRICASTLADIYSCVTIVIGTLRGPLHGGANERVFNMLTEIREMGNIRACLKEKLDSQKKVMGFGRRTYKTQDPREKYLREMARAPTEGTENEVWFNLSREVEDYMKHTKGFIPNVNFYSAMVYRVLGIDSSILALIFVMSRVSGWTAHIQEQQRNDELIRPRSYYTEEPSLKYTPLEER